MHGAQSLRELVAPQGGAAFRQSLHELRNMGIGKEPVAGLPIDRAHRGIG